MCGIAGYYLNSDEAAIQEPMSTLQKMADAMIHRGPDAVGFFYNESCGLAHRRLKIIDLSDAANQPMVDDSTGNKIIFNGEIYNYKALKIEMLKKYNFKTESDTEVLLAGLTLFGTSFINKLEGDFSFAFWSNNKLILCRDRFGIKPLYYYQTKDSIWFASEIKSLLAAGIKAVMNKTKISEYFRYRYIAADETLFQGIKHLLPGHYLSIDENERSLICYYDLAKAKSNPQFFERNFKKSVLDRLNSDKKIGLFLSGGIDSSSIGAQIKNIDKNIATFTYSFNIKNDVCIESKAAKELADQYSFTNQVIFHEKESYLNYRKIIKSLEEPIADSIIIANDKLFEISKQNVTVALSGEGADEIFSSYAHHRVLQLIFLLKKIKPIQFFCIQVIKLIPIHFLNKISFYPANFSSELKNKIISSLESRSKHDSFKNLCSLFSDSELRQLLISDYYTEDTAFFETNMQTTDLKNWLPKYGLMRIDKLSMAHSLEVRLPFLNHHVVESAYNTSWSESNFFGSDKPRFRNFCKKILGLNSVGVRKNKRPFFAPSEKIFSDNYSHFILETLSEEKINKFKILNHKFINQLISRKSDFLNSKKITSILVFQIWCEEFFESTQGLK